MYGVFALVTILATAGVVHALGMGTLERWFGLARGLACVGILLVASALSGATRQARGDVVAQQDREAIWWDVDHATWARFWRREWRWRVGEAVVIGVGGTLIGAAWVGDPYFAAMYSVGIGVVRLVWVTRGSLTARRRVALRGNRLVIGGMPHVVRSDRIRLVSAGLVDEGELLVLEIRLRWPTRHGEMNEEVRVPVPRSERHHAELLVSWLLD